MPEPQCQKHPFIAIGNRLKGIPEVLTLGLKPNFRDYSVKERDLIIQTPHILYPTLNYAQFFTTMGKQIFPSLETYLYSDEKIKQSTLFYMLGILHPHTKFYYHLHHQDIQKEFSFPFIAKLPRSSSQGRGVFLIHDSNELSSYLALTNIAYIQEYIPHEQDIRVILINYEPVLAYWRIKSEDSFKTNIAQGGQISFKEIPQAAIDTAILAARKCKFNDVGIDILPFRQKYYVIEANMKYGRTGLTMKNMVLKDILRQRLIDNKIFV